jgi:hypothetical protein
MKKELSRQDCRIQCVALKMKPDMFRSGSLNFCYNLHEI